MKKNLLISVRMTIATTILLGIIYPLVVTGLAQVFFKDKANGQLIVENGKVVGSQNHRPGIYWPGLFSLSAFGGGKWIRRCKFLGIKLGADE